MTNKEQKYMLVLFTDDPGVTRSIDIVPAKWLVYNEYLQSVACKFAPTFSKKNMNLLHALVRSDSDAPESWPIHRVSIRGFAQSYAQAEKKLQELETKDHVYSTDTEGHAKAREKAIVKRIKIKTKACERDDFNAIFGDSIVDLDHVSKTVPNRHHMTDTAKDLKKKNTNTKAPIKKDLSRNSKKENKSRWQAKIAHSEFSDDSQSEAISSSQSDKSQMKAAEGNIDLSTSIDSNVELRSSANLLNSSGHGGVTTSLQPQAPSNLEDVKSLVLECYRNLTAQLTQIRGQLADLKVTQTESTKMIASSETIMHQTNPGIDNCIKNHKLGDLPYRTLEEFINFDEKLAAAQQFREEIVTSLLHLINADPKKLGLSIRNIFRKVMTRNLLMNFTAVKPSGTKIVMKTGTTFFGCIRDAVLLEFRNTPYACEVKEKSITNAIAAAINSCKDWDGHRQARRKI